MQVLRVVPYSAAQLYSYEVFKRLFQDKEGELSVERRMMAGACAGMTATLVRARTLTPTPGCAVCVGWVAGGHGSHAAARALTPAPAPASTAPSLPQPSPPPRPSPPPPTQLTYPLDTLRLRMAVDPALVGLGGAVRVLLREGGSASFYRGLGASMLGERCDGWSERRGSARGW